MADKLKGLSIALLATNGVEQSEMTKPRKALEDEGATVHLISLKDGKIKAWKGGDWADSFDVDIELAKADPNAYQGLLLPGGVLNPDQLRMNDQAVAFVKHFVDSNKPIAAICHGPWTLINAGGIKGKTVTSWPSLKADLTNAGGKYVDKEVMRDGKLVTSRKPDDIPAFNKEFINLLSEGRV